MPANITNYYDKGVELRDLYIGASDISILPDAVLSEDALYQKYTGTMLGWGLNSTYGRLGVGDTTRFYYEPVSSGISNWKQIGAGRTSSAGIKLDGTLWTWGQNSDGRLGLGDTSDRFSPTKVGLLTDWKQVSCGDEFTAAIKTDGTLWHWGSLWHLNIGNPSSPVQFGSQINWKYVSSGVSRSFAIKTDGTLWAWGNNGAGALGLGDTVHRSTPVQIGTSNRWVYVETSATSSASAAIDIDGIVWTWGGETTNGVLGRTGTASVLGTVGITNAKKVSVMSTNMAVVTNDNKLWVWGHNYYGQLGNNTRTSSTTPLQLSSQAKDACCTYSSTNFIKTDGTLWGCGNGQQNGAGLTMTRSSPVQVGSLNTWKSLDSGQDFTLSLCSISTNLYLCKQFLHAKT